MNEERGKFNFKLLLWDIFRLALLLAALFLLWKQVSLAWAEGADERVEEKMKEIFSVVETTGGIQGDAPESEGIVFAGEVNLDERYNMLVSEAVRNPGTCIDDSLLEIFRSAEFLVGSNAGVFTTAEDREGAYRSAPSNAVFWSRIGADLVSLANDHADDYGGNSHSDSGMALTALGIAVSDDTYTAELKDGTVAIVLADLTEKAGLSACLKKIRDAEADHIIAYVHWGTEGSWETDKAQTDAAHAMIGAGATAIIGTHSHTLQGIEYYAGSPILYGIGDLWFGSAESESAAVFITIEENELVLKLIPCINVGSRTYIAIGERRAEILARLNLSETAKIDEDGLISEK